MPLENPAVHFGVDPVTGRVRGGPGRPKGQSDVVIRLAKHDIQQAFDKLGGVDELVRWARLSPHNQRVFYAQIWARLLPAQAADAIATKLSELPTITRIENVVIQASEGRIVESPVSTVRAGPIDHDGAEDVPMIDVSPERAPEPGPADDELTRVRQDLAQVRRARARLEQSRTGHEAPTGSGPANGGDHWY